jgi:hypothetical protein
MDLHAWAAWRRPAIKRLFSRLMSKADCWRVFAFFENAGDWIEPRLPLTPPVSTGKRDALNREGDSASSVR